MLLLFFYWSVFYVCLKCQSLRWKIWVYVCIFIMKEVKQSDPSIQQLVFNLLSSCFSCSSKRMGTVSFPGSITSPWLQKQIVLLSLWEMLWTTLSISSCGKMLQQRQCWWKWVAEEYCKIHVEPSMTSGGAGHTDTLGKASQTAGCDGIAEHWAAARARHLQQEENKRVHYVKWLS